MMVDWIPIYKGDPDDEDNKPIFFVGVEDGGLVSVKCLFTNITWLMDTNAAREMAGALNVSARRADDNYKAKGDPQ